MGVSALKERGKLHSDPNSKAAILQRQFQSVFTQDENSPNRNLKMEGPSSPSIPPLHVREPGVQKLLNNIKPAKAGGPDEIAGKLLRELASELAPFMIHLFNKSLQSGDVPSFGATYAVHPHARK